MNPVLKRYLISSLTTFLATFLGTLSMQISNGALTSGAFTVSFFLGFIGVAGRAAIKAVVEGIVGDHADPQP